MKCTREVILTQHIINTNTDIHVQCVHTVSLSSCCSVLHVVTKAFKIQSMTAHAHLEWLVLVAHVI